MAGKRTFGTLGNAILEDMIKNTFLWRLEAQTSDKIPYGLGNVLRTKAGEHSDIHLKLGECHWVVITVVEDLLLTWKFM